MRIICEPAANWEGDLDKAKEFISESKRLGLWAIKFQLYDEHVMQGPYYDYLKKSQLDYGMAKELFEYGKSIDQEVFFTVMYEEAVDICERIEVNYYKIRYNDSPENFERPSSKKHILLKKVIETNKPYFTSRKSYCIYSRGKALLLLCVPHYPANIIDYLFTDLDSYSRYRKFHGISDHTNNLTLFCYLRDHEKLMKERNINCSNAQEGYYFEKHIRLNGTHTLEDPWSITFEELEKVLENEK